MSEVILRRTQLDCLEVRSGNLHVLKFPLMTLTPSDCRYPLLHNHQELDALGVLLKASSLLIYDLCHQDVALRTRD